MSTVQHTPRCRLDIVNPWQRDEAARALRETRAHMPGADRATVMLQTAIQLDAVKTVGATRVDRKAYRFIADRMRDVWRS